MYNFKIVLLSTTLLLIFTIISVISSRPRNIHSQSNPSSTLSVSIENTKPVNTTQITLNNLFEDKSHLVDKLPQDEIVTLLATGDVMLGRSVGVKTIQNNSFTWAFDNIAPLFESADISLVNLEGPFGNDCEATNKGMVFCVDKRQTGGLVDSSVDVVNIANNHISDQGIEGLETTLSLLNKNGFVVSGVKAPGTLSTKGTNIAFLGFNSIFPRTAGVLWADTKTVRQKISQASEMADFVVTSFHWGKEYQSKPTVKQIELAHTAIDSGADLVIGHHPHWIQPFEVYKGKVIAYSLGNFIFDQMWSVKTRRGLAVKFVIYNNEVIATEPYPVIIENFGQPRLANEDEKNRILQELEKSSLVLTTP